MSAISIVIEGTLAHGRDSFANLWDEINAKRGFPWESNPWIWRIEFRRMSNV